MIRIGAVAELFVIVEAPFYVHCHEIYKFFLEYFLEQAIIRAVCVELYRLIARRFYEAQEMFELVALQRGFSAGNHYGVRQFVGYRVPNAAVNFFIGKHAAGIHYVHVMAVRTVHVAAGREENRGALMRIVAEARRLIAVNANL